MIHRQSAAPREINDHSGQQHEKVRQDEARQVQPAKAFVAELFLTNQRPPNFQPALEPGQQPQAEEDLAHRHEPRDLRQPVEVIDKKRNAAEQHHRAEKRHREEETLRNHLRDPHQDIHQNHRDEG